MVAQADFDQGVAVWERAMSEELCSECIWFHNELKDMGFVSPRHESGYEPTIAVDDSTFYGNYPWNRVDEETSITRKELIVAVHNQIFECLKDYQVKYHLHKQQFYNWDIKSQRTKPAEGYHAWHFESSKERNRMLAWMIYLNDVEDGGETEFLHLSKRVKPTQGTVMIWPADFYHLHRGNPPLKGDKYVLTGWFTIS